MANLRHAYSARKTIFIMTKHNPASLLQIYLIPLVFAKCGLIIFASSARIYSICMKAIPVSPSTILIAKNQMESIILAICVWIISRIVYHRNIAFQSSVKKSTQTQVIAWNALKDMISLSRLSAINTRMRK